jgi:hypothetical protein
MELIDPLNPKHSRPIDVHRWSDHPEVAGLVEAIWSEHFTDYMAKESVTSGVKAKRKHRDQLRVVLLDLYVAWLTDPDLSIGVHLSMSSWNTNSRYNALHLSKIIPDLVRRLSEVGLIQLAKGSYSGPGNKHNRTSRIRAEEPLKKLFRDAKFGREHIWLVPNRECIILKDTDDFTGRKGKEVPYEDDDRTNRMRQVLQDYNTLLARTFIDIPTYDHPFVERTITTGPQAGEVINVPIGTQENFVRRIFNRGSFDCGGRFFGGWWQHIDSELRKRIHINDVPTVEIDYQALHVAVLSAEKDVEIDHDPYELDASVLPEMDKWRQRALVKLLVLMAFNAKSKRAACLAFRQDQATGSTEKSMKDEELLKVLDAFVEKNPHLEDAIGADRGITLMNTDSRIAEIVVSAMTKLNIPVLCIHDSFVVDYNHFRILRGTMRFAARKVLGREVALSQNYVGLDDVKLETPDLVEDYLEMRRLHRSPGYQARGRVFRERLTYLGGTDGE